MIARRYRTPSLKVRESMQAPEEEQERKGKSNEVGNARAQSKKRRLELVEDKGERRQGKLWCRQPNTGQSLRKRGRREDYPYNIFLQSNLPYHFNRTSTINFIKLFEQTNYIYHSFLLLQSPYGINYQTI